VKKSDVPQDRGIYVGSDILTYAVDERGRYVGALSAGWDAANVANGVAVREIERETAEVLELVRRGERSPLAYHMVHRRMDEKLLADYAGVSLRQLRRHLTPAGFGELTAAERLAYAEALDLSADALAAVPPAGSGPR
jgi:hypothetical protein